MSFRPIFGTPRLTSDWGEEQHERETHWTSLFYDLLIVAALNAIAEPFEEMEEETASNHSSSSFILSPIRHLWLNALLRFVSVLTPWNSLNEFTSIFEDESVLGHLCFFAHCFGLASTVAGCVGDLEDNYRTLAFGIITAKLGLLILHIRPYIYVPRSRAHCMSRCASFSVVIALMLWGLRSDFAHFRTVLIVASICDLISPIILVMVLREQRVPLHVQAYADRQKEVTMVIFGEAIFAVTLRTTSNASLQSHFYVSLFSTLWLVYSLALQEFHILPNADDHALRRSLLFGFSWYYTQFFKQVFLLGASIGIKRAHLLTFVAPQKGVDSDTVNLVVWGISLTLFAVVMIRSYSFGYGRHPNKNDPPELWRTKCAWWLGLSVMCLGPQVVNNTVLIAFGQPLALLVALGATMLAIIMFEAHLSNRAAEQTTKMAAGNGEVNETTYLTHTLDLSHTETAFLRCFAPKNETLIE